MNNWRAKVVGEAFVNDIPHKIIAERAGYNPRYLSAILNGKRNPKNAESRIKSAIAEIIRERENNE